MIAGGSPDVIVVGAGVVGAACADAIARTGRTVLVIESGIVGGGTTAAGMGHLVVMDDSPAQLALTARSLTLWRALYEQLPLEVEVDRCGTLWIAEDDTQLAALQEKRAAYASVGVDAEVLDSRATAEAEPSLRAGLVGSLRVPGDAVVYPPTAALALIDRARANGARLREGVRVDAIGSRSIECDGERLYADIVINAAGAGAPRLTPGLPILPRKGHLAITDRVPGRVHHQLVELGYLTSAHVMTNESVAFNVQPRSTGQLLIGSSRELVGWASEMNLDILRRMLARAVEFIPSLRDLSIIRTWTGFRPATLDKLPLIGPWDEESGVWVAAGHEGLGITTSLATGELIAALVSGAAPPIDPRPYAATRPSAEHPPMRIVA